MRYRIKAPESYAAACSLMARMASKAMVLGPSATRRYRTHLGPWDADYFEAACEAVLGLADSGALSMDQVAQIHRTLLGHYWTSRQFKRARALAERVTPVTGRELRALRAGISVVEVLDLSDDDEAVVNAMQKRLDEAGGRPPVDDEPVEDVDQREIRGTHAPMLDLAWAPGLSTGTTLGARVDAGEDIRACASVDALPIEQLVSREYPARPVMEMGQEAHVLIVGAKAMLWLAPHLPAETFIQRAVLDGEHPVSVVQIGETDCLEETSSCITRSRSGRVKVARGMFDMDAVGDRKLFRPPGSHEIFVAPGFVKPLRILLKDGGIRGVRVLDDVCDR